MEAESRRRQRVSAREAAQRQRLLSKQGKQLAKLAEREQAAYEVAKYENYVDLIVSLHKECGDTWSWEVMATAEAPVPPLPRHEREAAAESAMREYKPGFLERLLRRDTRRMAEFHASVARGRKWDAEKHAQALERHSRGVLKCATERALAARVLAGEGSALAEALQYSEAFEELASFGTRVRCAAALADVVQLEAAIADPEIVPKEEVKLTATGKLTSKSLSAARYWGMYQDHVCSCAIRIAAETFAVLPVRRVIVNLIATVLNSSTGHDESSTLLAVHFTREGFARLNLAAIDPSDAMRNFPHRMKYNKTSGFESVDPITPDDQWVTT
jgi:hypothetical protein